MGCSNSKAIKTKESFKPISKLADLDLVPLYSAGSGSNKKLEIHPSRCAVRRASKVSNFYSLGVKIGTGPHGHTRIATHILTGQKRVIRVVEKSTIRTPEQQERFLNEMEVLKSLDHPHIVKLIECYEDELNYHIVTEYIPGGELIDHLLKNKTINETTSAFYIKQVLSALAYIHSKSLVHQNIQPCNVLLDSSENETVLKLVGFSFTNHKINVFKDLEMISYCTAPEVLSSKPCSDKSDVWSCGVILYMLIAGKPPFEDNENLHKRILNPKITFLSHLWGQVSDECIKLIKKMLQVKPEKRISALEALQSPWLIKESPSIISCNDSALANLISFYTTKKIQRIFLSFIVNQVMQKGELSNLYKKFKEIDKDKDGKISKDELLQAYLSFIPSRQANGEVDRILKACDYDGSGFIDYSEFVTSCAWKEVLNTKEKVALGFRSIDIDESGLISKGELREILGSVCDRDLAVEKIMRKVDLNGDGVIDVQEFENIIYGYLRQDDDDL